MYLHPPSKSKIYNMTLPLLLLEVRICSAPVLCFSFGLLILKFVRYHQMSFNQWLFLFLNRCLELYRVKLSTTISLIHKMKIVIRVVLNKIWRMDPDNLRPFNYPSDRYIATTERKGTTLSLENLYWGCFSEEGKLSLVDFSLREKSMSR